MIWEDAFPMPRSNSWLLLAAFLLSGLGTLVGCAPKIYDDPIPVMADAGQTPSVRLDAAEQARQKMPDDPRRLQALQNMLFAWRQPAELRQYAVDELVRIDEAAFAKTIQERIVEVHNDEIAQHIFQLGVQRKWPDFSLAVLHRYALKQYGVPDRDRPEHQVLEQLNPGQTAEQVIAGIFANPGATGKLSAAQQVRAWELLNRLCLPREIRGLLAAAPETTALVVDLKACLADLSTVPTNEKGIQWLYFLRDPQRQALWNSYKACVARLTPEQREGLELRHLAVLVQLDDKTYATAREDLLTELKEALRGRGREHHLTSMSADGGDKDHPQRIAEWAPQLQWADLATIRLLMGLMEDRVAVAELFKQADADRLDTATEYGGVIAPGSTPAPGFSPPPLGEAGRGAAPSFIVQGYAPLLRDHDRKFIPPPAMTAHLFTALAHYHFHAQQYRNEEFAGPGKGDLENADGWHINFLVFTFIDRDRLNVDYYQHGRIVVDLGTVRR
jgi:hypothetical protein